MGFEPDHETSSHRPNDSLDAVVTADPTTEALSTEAIERRAWSASEGAVRYNLKVGDLTMEEQTDALRLIRGLSADVNALAARLREAQQDVADREEEVEFERAQRVKAEKALWQIDKLGASDRDFEEAFREIKAIAFRARTLAASPGGGEDE